MPLIPEGVIDEIQARADIAEMIGRYVPLKRAGRHFKAICPFHKEKTPSFMVNTDKQIYHCFGCGAGGNIFSFLMQHDRLTFPEAVRQLADHVGVPVPDVSAGGGNGEHAQLIGLLDKVCQYYERLLADPKGGKAAREYLVRRGVSEQARAAFRLGLSPVGWDRMLAAATATGVSAQQLEAAGLVIRGRSSYYDRFRHRLIFPITDARGRVLGFGGRSLDAQEPKYLNSPETALYSKGRQLFGLAQAKEAIMASRAAVIVEGYFDCVVLAGGGIANVVSPLGTALTIEQARLLKRYAERVTLAFDADAAGEAATLRGIDLLVETGLRVHVAKLPAGQDPDECLQAYGRERFQQLLDRSAGVFEFLLEVALRRFRMHDLEEKVSAAQFILPTIAKVPDAILRSEYVRQLAERLQLDEAAVAQELARVPPRTGAEGLARAQPPPSTHPVAQGPERLLTALVLDEPLRWKRVEEGLSLEDVADPTLRTILRVICELSESRQPASPAQVVSRLSEDGHGALVTSLVELARAMESKEAAFEDCLRRIKGQVRKRRLDRVRQQLESAQQAQDEIAVQRWLQEYQRLISQPAEGDDAGRREA